MCSARKFPKHVHKGDLTEPPRQSEHLCFSPGNMRLKFSQVIYFQLRKFQVGLKLAHGSSCPCIGIQHSLCLSFTVTVHSQCSQLRRARTKADKITAQAECTMQHQSGDEGKKQIWGQQEKVCGNRRRDGRKDYLRKEARR